jgi:hypothetical protein
MCINLHLNYFLFPSLRTNLGHDYSYVPVAGPLGVLTLSAYWNPKGFSAGAPISNKSISPFFALQNKSYQINHPQTTNKTICYLYSIIMGSSSPMGADNYKQRNKDQ